MFEYQVEQVLPSFSENGNYWRSIDYFLVENLIAKEITALKRNTKCRVKSRNLTHEGPA
jgi:hypothetical protein